MVDPEEFERVRGLLDEAIQKEFQDLLVNPAEVLPGHWGIWPYRKVEVAIVEIRPSIYGKPGFGDGRLQALVHWPYGNTERIKPRKTEAFFDEKVAKRAMKVAREVSNSLTKHYKLDEDDQVAYLWGYQSTIGSGPDRLKRMWPVREVTWRGKPWEPLHIVVNNFFFETRQKDPEEWDRLFSGPVQHSHPREWSPRTRGYNERRYNDFFSGVLDALDDWARETGLLEKL